MVSSRPIENVTARNITINRKHALRRLRQDMDRPQHGLPAVGRGRRARPRIQHNLRLRDAGGLLGGTQCTSLQLRGRGLRDEQVRSASGTSGCWAGPAPRRATPWRSCGAAARAPCAGWVVEGVVIVDPVSGTRPARYLCDNVVDLIGFNCTGAPWGENNR